VQLPTWEARYFDLQKMAESKTYAQEIQGIVKEAGLEITELSTHLQGQLVAVHPAYDELFDGFAPTEVHGNKQARTQWAIKQLEYAAEASKNLGIDVHASFSGALLWPYMYPWPQRSSGLVEEGFKTLAKVWTPILNKFDACGVDVCYELHPGEDLHDGITFERFLEATNNHKRANILYDPSHFVADWDGRPGRFRSLGDGQVDFKGIFSRLTHHDFKGWAVVEWECYLKDNKQGAKEGAISFDDFAAADQNDALNKRILGL